MFGGPLDLGPNGPKWDDFEEEAWEQQWDIVKDFVNEMNRFVKT